jgi:methyl-accepting chemotaxis protein
MRTSLFPAPRRSRASSDLVGLLAEVSNPLRVTLDNMEANCFIADLHLNLVYMNRRAEKTTTALAPTIRQTFGVELRDVLGGSIHRFHQDPARIERILADPSALPRQAVFNFGGITLRTAINAITTAEGQRLGYVVIWDNVSERNAHAAATFAESQVVTRGLSEVSRTLTSTAEDTSQRAITAASATEQMTSAVHEIARASSEAAVQVRRTVEATADNLVQLRELQQMSSEIGDFLRLVTGVAEQTKLLALNAAIEAARAGEGFAVVADEVKQLAGATAASIGDIEQRISAIQAAAAASVQAVTTIDALVDSIRESQETIAAAIEEQSAVTGSISEAIAVIADRAQETSSQAAQVGSAVEAVTQQTQTLREIVETS